MDWAWSSLVDCDARSRGDIIATHCRGI